MVVGPIDLREWLLLLFVAVRARREALDRADVSPGARMLAESFENGEERVVVCVSTPADGTFTA
jgi:hypothetical protein